jgi:hypothetical protein
MQMQMQSEERMQSFGLHFLDERMQKPFLLGGIVTKSSVFYYSLCINAKMQREKNTQRRTLFAPKKSLNHTHTSPSIKSLLMMICVPVGVSFLK